MTPSRDNLRGQLEAIGSRPPLTPSSEFVARLHARLADASPTLSPVIPMRRPTRSVVRPVVLSGAAAAAAALVLAGSFAGWFDGGGGATTRRDELALAAAIDTVVVLPDGNEVLGIAGLALPDDSIVRTGPNGSATIGATQLGPQQEGIVDAGELRLRPPTTASSGPLTGAPVGVGPTTPTKPTVSTAPTTTTTSGSRRPGGSPPTQPQLFGP